MLSAPPIDVILDNLFPPIATGLGVEPFLVYLLLQHSREAGFERVGGVSQLRIPFLGIITQVGPQFVAGLTAGTETDPDQYLKLHAFQRSIGVAVAEAVRRLSPGQRYPHND